MTMANTQLTAFVSEIQKFINHWTQVNAALPPTKPLLLAKGYTLANLQSDLAALQADMNATVTGENAVQGANNQRDATKEVVRERHRQFRQGVQGRLAETKYVAMLPTLPALRATEGVTLKAFQDVLDIWKQIDTDTVIVPASERPFLLADDYGQAAFAADLTTLMTAFTAVSTANSTLSTARKNRDAGIKAIRKRVLLYGKSVSSRLTAGHPLTQNLPSVP